MSLLDYENEIFLSSFHEDGLLITARGLGIERIFENFLKVYSNPENLVLVINTEHSEEEYFIERLALSGIKHLPKMITNEYSSSERNSVYLQGGVLFITSRILVVDMLVDRLPIDHVTGILVYKAHKIIDSCQEAFILRLFRQKNKDGIIKAFSDNPQAFTTGLCRIERTMKSLFVKKLYLWPRFHAEVSALMDRHKPEVLELLVPMTNSMISIQTSLLDIMNAVVKEIKRFNPTLDMDQLTVENALGKKSLDMVIRKQLDPVWHYLSSKTRTLVSDLKLLRMLLYYLTQYDCVTFNILLDSLRSSQKAFGQNSGWLFMDSSNSMFTHANDRVYGTKNLKKKQKQKEADEKIEESKELFLEENPKWNVLKDLLNEIDIENKDNKSRLGSTGRVLITAADDRTCAQLNKLVNIGSRALLTNIFEKSMKLKKNITETEQENTKKEKIKEGKKGKSIQKNEKDKETTTLTQMYKKCSQSSDDECNKDEADLSKTEEVQQLNISSRDAYYDVFQEPVTVIHPLNKCSQPYNLTKTLNEVEPRYVILYDAEVDFVRKLEIYKASRPGIPLRVYLLMYQNSAEEQRYLTSLRKETEAFEQLIKDKASMVISEDMDVRLGTTGSSASASVSTRKAGGQLNKPDVQHKVIVDMREFRSELPSLIHRRGINIEPVTLDVGDYILTPDICVERKSVSDLIGSLNSGRLFNQATAMTRYYKQPVLLIEFDPQKPFSLKTRGSVQGDTSFKNIMSKLTLLTLHFPRLKIIWCPSPHVSAEIVEELKTGQEQPDAVAAAAVTTDEKKVTAEQPQMDKYNHGPLDFVLKLPGVDSRNYWRILQNVRNLAELITLPEEKLCEILCNQVNGKLLWEFLHTDSKEKSDSGQVKPLAVAPPPHKKARISKKQK